MARIIISLFVILFSVYVTEQAYFLQQDYIDKINEVTKWKAGINFDPNTPKENILRLLGSKGVQTPNALNIHMYKTHDDNYKNINEIPDTFDARENWKQCDTIGEVRDQGQCGSCWAVSTSSAFSDRMCIATNGTFDQLLSIQELAFCCYLCGFGCNGGYPIKAWNYFKRHGIVTGGDYGTTDGCQPYRVPPSDETDTEETNHHCTRKCYGDEEIKFRQDHHRTKDAYYLTYENIQKDIMTYGPIEASIDVYDDFMNYKSGVYVKTPGATKLGGHAVKLIGWGEENHVPYWLLVNSWNVGWGEEGLFKIRRGTNECGVDNSTTAGVPAVTDFNNFY